MRLRVAPFACLLLTAAVLAQVPIPPAKRANFDVQKIADGVYALVRRDPPGLMCDGNTLFIINDDDVVVVDTNNSPSEAREMIAALRKLTPKPVRYVINTHWHDDHIMGNAAFRQAFPQAEFIAHENTREYLPAKGMEARKHMLEGAPPVVKKIRDLVAENKSFSGAELTPEERAAYISDVQLVDRYLAEVPKTEIVLPTITVKDELLLYRGNRIIDIRYLGRGHTSGDLIVYLPKENIVASGDLVVWPVPLIGSDQSHISEWPATLDKLVALKPTAIVPGHGPVLRDDSYPRALAAMLTSITEQTRAAVARGETAEQAHKSVNLDEFRHQIAGDDKIRNLLFSNYVAYPAVEAAYKEASAAGRVAASSATGSTHN